ncbi:MAG TPA: MaoC family dehydratase [Chloroflexota bacterium]|nr:MaoC family dehydratase [Chloroflexota bacterium]
MRYFEDFPAGLTVELGSASLTADEIITFARRYDPQPMHTDAVAGAQSIYGSLIASGWQTAGCYMRLLVDSVIGDSASLGSPGIDNLRWLKPVKPGDVLRGRFSVLEANLSRSRPDWGIVRSRGELVNQSDETVMQVEAVNFFARRPKSQAD